MNPFEEDAVCLPVIKTEETMSDISPDIPKTHDVNEHITFEAIASKLINDNLFLTALELHTELVESGREIPRLRDYFSNPANFERTKLDVGLPGISLRKLRLANNV